MQHQTSQAVDFVLIIGNDSAGNYAGLVKDVIEQCKRKNLTYTIVGNGARTVSPSEIENLPKANNVAILGHGDMHTWKSKINLLGENASRNSLDLTVAVQNKTQSKNIIFCSCYGGKLIREIQKSNPNILLSGTNLFIPAPVEESSFFPNNKLIIHGYIENILPGEISSLVKILEFTLKSTSETTYFLHNVEDEQNSHRPFVFESLRVHKSHDYSDREILKNYQEQIMKLNYFLHEIDKNDPNSIFISELKDNHAAPLPPNSFVSANMSLGEVEENKSNMLMTHICHNDITIVDSLLANASFHSKHLYYLIKFSKDNLSEMLDVLLKHQKNAMHGQTINRFQERWKSPGIWFSEDYDHYTPLTLAIENSKLSMIKVLLKNGADIYLPDKAGRIPAQFLKNQKYHAMFKDLLIEAKKISDLILLLQSHPSFHHEPYFKAVIKYRDHFIKICSNEHCEGFFNGTDFPISNKNVFKAFQGFLRVAKMAKSVLLQKIPEFETMNGFDLKIKDIFLDKAVDEFFNAAIHGNLNTLRKMIKSGMPINNLSKEGNPAIYYAIKNEHIHIAAELIKSGADCTHIDLDGNTLLHMAFNSANYKMIMLIFTHLPPSFNINAVNKAGNSLLHSAVAYGSIDVVKLLLDLGANTKVSNNEGEWPIQIAKEYDHDDIFELLKNGNEPSPALPARKKATNKTELPPPVPPRINRPPLMPRSNNGIFTSPNYAHVNAHEKILKFVQESIDALETSIAGSNNIKESNENYLSALARDFFKKTRKNIIKNGDVDKGEDILKNVSEVVSGILNNRNRKYNYNVKIIGDIQNKLREICNVSEIRNFSRK